MLWLLCSVFFFKKISVGILPLLPVAFKHYAISALEYDMMGPVKRLLMTNNAFSIFLFHDNLFFPNEFPWSMVT